MATVAELIREARALVFDFDGTLVDSNAIKRRAFERCFSEFPDRLEEIMRYCGRYHIVAAEVPGAARCLKAGMYNHTTAVLSSTPHEILFEILEARDWLNYFKYIQGAPVRDFMVFTS